MRWLKIFLVIVLVLAAGAVGAGYWGIQSAVRGAVDLAQEKHPHAGDDAAALAAYVDASQHPFEKRNRAVWALGRLGDAKALPTLKRHFDGKPCDHEKRLCQYELAKAINQCLDSLPHRPQGPSTNAEDYEQPRMD